MSVKVAIVLAAGKGERMGGNKALLLLEGKPLVKAHIERALEAGCERVVVVTRADIAARLGEIAQVTVVSVDTDDQSKSLALGARKIGKRGDTQVLITPVDAPPVAKATIDALFQAIDGGADVATPLDGERGGHPVVCRAKILAVYGKEHDDNLKPLNEVLRTLESSRKRVAVDDPRVGIDLDTPDDVQALTGEPPRFW